MTGRVRSPRLEAGKPRRGVRSIAQPAIGRAHLSSRSGVDSAAVNLAIFDAADVVSDMGDLLGDRGEIAALLTVADEVRNEPVLDVGVGGGRTTWFMRLLTPRYTGVDIAANMVAKCRENFPEADIRLTDARDLGEFPDACFALVMFSNNGIDAVDHVGRARVLAEFARVVRPGGYVHYSTHNLAGGSFGETPWQRRRPYESSSHSARKTISFVLHLPFRLGYHAESFRNYARNRLRLRVESDWAVGPLRAHKFGILAHFIRVPAILAELDEAGFQLTQLFTLEGRAIQASCPETHTDYFHVVARKPASAHSGIVVT